MEFRLILGGTKLKASQIVKQERTYMPTDNLSVQASFEHSNKLMLAAQSTHKLHLMLEPQKSPRNSEARTLVRTSLQQSFGNLPSEKFW
jgi:hypothetical protein